MPDVGRHIADYRKQSALTQEQLATALHVTRQTVSSWENGRTLPDVDSLASVAEALHVSVEELIYGKRTAAPAQPQDLSRHRTLAVITGVLAILTVLLQGVWPELSGRLSPGWLLALTCLLRPLGWIFCTVQLLALVSLNRPLPLKNGIRRAILWTGMLLAAVYLILCLALWIPGLTGMAVPWAGAPWALLNSHAWIFVLTGGALFFGMELSLKSK